MDKRPIGMFDSGVGGMTVLKQIAKKLPNEDILYVGDTLRFPYGSKSKQTIIELAHKWIEFLIQKNVKLIVIACGTATSQALEEVKGKYEIPIIGIIEPTVQYLKQKQAKRVGIIATAGTIRSHAWEEKIKQALPAVFVQSKACPMLAPMAEEGWTNNQIAKLAIQEYMKEFKQSQLDSLVLGCTHYPLFQPLIQEELGNSIKLINTGEMVASYIEEMLKTEQKSNENRAKSTYTICLTDIEGNFVKVVKQFMKEDPLDFTLQKI